jgi:transcriptional regulator GlxA family with amidase domain
MNRHSACQLGRRAIAAVVIVITTIASASASAQRSDTALRDAQVTRMTAGFLRRPETPTLPVIAIGVDSAGTELTDFMIPHAVLTESGVARVVSVALHAGRIRLRPGTVSIEPDLTMAAFDAANSRGADYVVVPALVDHESPAIAAWIRAQAARGATIVSICEGARTVAKSGVLEGRRATTHWSALGELSKRYPGTTWVRNLRYVVDDHIITTTGVSAALPASIVLIDRIAGRAAAESMARRVGLTTWDPTHDTDAFHVTRWIYVKGAWNTLAPWRHEAVGVRVAPGFDEIALAFTVDAISRSIRGRAFTASEDGAPVTGRQGLRISVDRPYAAIETGTREIALPSPLLPPASALDSAIVRLTSWYGSDAAELISLGMEHPIGRPTRAPREVGR